MERILIRETLENIGFKKEDSEHIENVLYQVCGNNLENYVEFSYQKLGELMVCDDVEIILSDILEGIAGWNSSFFSQFKIKEVQSQTKLITVKGAFVCSKCGCDECSFYQVQLRRADEGMTSFITCTNCNNKWKTG